MTNVETNPGIVYALAWLCVQTEGGICKVWEDELMASAGSFEIGVTELAAAIAQLDGQREIDDTEGRRIINFPYRYTLTASVVQCTPEAGIGVKPHEGEE